MKLLVRVQGLGFHSGLLTLTLFSLARLWPDLNAKPPAEGEERP